MSDTITNIEATVALLRKAPLDRFLKAMASLEEQGDLAEIQQIKNLLRDRLAEIRPPRRLNATRLFCDPFEELLRNETDGTGTWIPRSAISVCWRIVEGRMKPKVLNDIKKKLVGLNASDRDKLLKLAAPIWTVASTELAAVAAAARNGDSEALELLGGDETMIGHAETIAAACQVAPAIEELKEMFPQRTSNSAKILHKETLLEELKRYIAENKHDVRCIVHIVAHWTANPAEIFDLCGKLDLRQASPLGRILMAQREKLIVGLLGEQMKNLQAGLDTENLDLASCTELARVAADSIGSAIDMITERGAGGQSAQIETLKRELTTIVQDKVIGVASEALNSVWGGKSSDGDAAQDREAIHAAESAARAMHKCGKLASRLGIESAVSQKISASLDSVRGDVAGKIADIGSDTKPADLVAVKSTIANATRILEILEGPERAFEFYREKQAAIRAQS